jgi:hypothetical protein
MRKICGNSFSIFPGHGPIGKSSSVIETALNALDPVLKMNLLELNENECLEKWRRLSNVPFKASSNMFWVEWDEFLNSSVVQSDMFVFAKLKVEHEH